MIYMLNHGLNPVKTNKRKLNPATAAAAFIGSGTPPKSKLLIATRFLSPPDVSAAVAPLGPLPPAPLRRVAPPDRDASPRTPRASAGSGVHAFCISASRCLSKINVTGPSLTSPLLRLDYTFHHS